MLSWQSEELTLEQLMPLFRETLDAGRSVRFSPRGVSMLPMLRQGKDSVRLSPLPGKLRKYDLPLYQRKSGSYVLHRIVKVQDTYTCIGDNQFDFERMVHHEQMIGVVSAFYRGDREISVNSLKYRLYCRVWHYSRPIRHFYRLCIASLRRRFK